MGSGDLVRGYILSSSHNLNVQKKCGVMAFHFRVSQQTHKAVLHKCSLSFSLYICNSGKRLIDMLAFQRCWEAIMPQKTYSNFLDGKHCSPAFINILHIEVIKYLALRIAFPIFFFLISQNFVAEKNIS